MKTFTLGELAVMKYGKLPPKDILESGCPIFTGYRVSGYAKDYLYENPMLVIVARGVGGTGDVKLSPPKSWITNLSIVLDLDVSKADKQFLCYFLGQESLKDKLNTGSAQAQITVNSLTPYQVTIPSLPVQRRIASILSAYDDLIENNTRRIAILEEMARRLYEEWFVRFRFPGHEGVPLVESELGLVPEGWQVRAFEEIATFINGYAFKPADLGAEGLPIVKIKELKAGVQVGTPRFAKTLAERYRIKNGSLLFSWSADLDVYRWANGEGWLNQHLFLVESRNDSLPLPNSFLFHALAASMPSFRALSNGATMKHIKRSALSEVKTLLPQSNALSEFDRIVQPIHDLVIRLSQKNANLRTTRDLLLPKLISGELDVSTLPEPQAETA